MSIKTDAPRHCEEEVNQTEDRSSGQYGLRECIEEDYDESEKGEEEEEKKDGKEEMEDGRSEV